MSDDLVKRICQQWIDAGCADECFWEQWSHCPSGKDNLTPRMVLDRIEKLEAKLAKLTKAANRVHDSYWNDADGIIVGMFELGEALREARTTLSELTGGKDDTD